MRRQPRFSVAMFGLVAGTALLSFAGCGRPQNAQQRLGGAMNEAGIPRAAVFPFAGTVTVDGEAPPEEGTVIVMLNDVSKPQASPSDRMFVACDSKGEFAFSTYMRGDGVPEGSYVVTVAQLKQTRDRRFTGTDRFRNIYSDPEALGPED